MKKLFSAVLSAFLLLSCSSNAAKEDTKPASTPVDTQKIVVDNMLNRRSIRSYKPEQVEKSKIDTILLCAINAPSANNKQPWEVRVIQNPELLNKIKAINENIYHNSPSLIIIAKDTKNPYGDFDCGILTQNILLSAEAMGLGTCSLGGLGRLMNTPEAKEIRESLNLPPDYEVILGISLGYANESPEAKPREKGKVQYID